MTNVETATLGAVLAGGQSRRFVSDKALGILNGRPLIVHARDAIARHVAEVVVCGRSFPGMRALADRPAPHLGPLGGLNAALQYARDHDFAAVLTIGCDMPILPVDVACALIEGGGPAIVEGQFLLGYWPSTLAGRLDSHLQNSGDRSMRGWLSLIDPRLVAAPMLPNVNYPEDLARLTARTS
jgi:molybdopterin-guanine dinucleotide biosynthesis protein A